MKLQEPRPVPTDPNHWASIAIAKAKQLLSDPSSKPKIEAEVASKMEEEAKRMMESSLPIRVAIAILDDWLESGMFKGHKIDQQSMEALKQARSDLVKKVVKAEEVISKYHSIATMIKNHNHKNSINWKWILPLIGIGVLPIIGYLIERRNARSGLTEL